MIGVIGAGFRGDQEALQCTRPQARLSVMVASTCEVDITSYSPESVDVSVPKMAFNIL